MGAPLELPVTRQPGAQYSVASRFLGADAQQALPQRGVARLEAA
jgi:hypothetical protein